ncbi:gibberellin-regulated protein 11-like [Prosopis cineraria]|uniref:gibberellin-regulated protein 11-like n=1 Tax=Prosopis cineraria TaxID=364024 RepID=UPI00240EE5CA|nr:gibberellin-regulated protein 11-like [Prosopis cineraria]
MAFSKTLAASLIFFTLVLLQLAQSHLVIRTAVDGPSPPPPHIDCDSECDRRCKLSSRPNLCKRACGTCCARCNCVPSGTSGNYDECPCYANMTTHGGRHKCP